MVSFSAPMVLSLLADRGQRLDDFSQEIGLCVVPLKVRIPLSAAVVYLVGLVELGIFYQQLNRLPARFSLLHRGFQSIRRIFAAIYGNQLHSRRQTGLLGGQPQNNILNPAVILPGEPTTE